jgi:hypothetical protein
MTVASNKTGPFLPPEEACRQQDIHTGPSKLAWQP